MIILLIRRPPVRGLNIFNFRQKLQLSFIGILLFSFILIGVVVAYITIGQYQSKHYENIKEKLNSVYIELESNLSMEKFISPDWKGNGYSSLNELLVKLSNVFNTDINLIISVDFLFLPHGWKIFDRDLTSERINNMALYNLEHRKISEYYQKEKSGIFSIYQPIFHFSILIIKLLHI